jgi:hypothetical protein
MNPIPLRHKRRVYAWACGRCHKIRAVGEYLGYPTDPTEHAERTRSRAESYMRAAESCCRCEDCECELAPGTTFGRCPPCEAKEEARVAKVTDKYRAKSDARDAHNAAAIAAAGGDPDAATMLRSLMSDLSEFCWCAGWLGGCEDSLWAFVTDGPGEWGMGEVNQRDVDELRRLSDKAGGWWVWDNAMGGNVFVPRAEWLARYADPSPEGGKVGA